MKGSQLLLGVFLKQTDDQYTFNGRLGLIQAIFRYREDFELAFCLPKASRVSFIDTCALTKVLFSESNSVFPVTQETTILLIVRVVWASGPPPYKGIVKSHTPLTLNDDISNNIYVSWMSNVIFNIY